MLSSHLKNLYNDLTKGRPTEVEYGFLQAIVTATRATCSRAKNGAVITRDGRVIASGYNGTLSGHPHCEHKCNCKGDLVLAPDFRTGTHSWECNSVQRCHQAVHAEHNAILFAARYGVATAGADMFCTMTPCVTCASAIVQAGITTVRYLLPYTGANGINILEKSGVKVLGYRTTVESVRPSEIL